MTTKEKNFLLCVLLGLILVLLAIFSPTNPTNHSHSPESSQLTSEQKCEAAAEIARPLLPDPGLTLLNAVCQSDTMCFIYFGRGRTYGFVFLPNKQTYQGDWSDDFTVDDRGRVNRGSILAFWDKPSSSSYRGGCYVPGSKWNAKEWEKSWAARDRD